MPENKFKEIKELVADAEVDADKFFNNRNGAAGTRLRKAYHLIAILCKEGRTEVTEIKNASKAEDL